MEDENDPPSLGGEVLDQADHLETAHPFRGQSPCGGEVHPPWVVGKAEFPANAPRHKVPGHYGHVALPSKASTDVGAVAGVAKGPALLVGGKLLQPLLGHQNVALHVLQGHVLQTGLGEAIVARAGVGKAVVANLVSGGGDLTPGREAFGPVVSVGGVPFGDEVESAPDPPLVHHRDGLGELAWRPVVKGEGDGSLVRRPKRV